jgi:hypothetical protein
VTDGGKVDKRAKCLECKRLLIEIDNRGQRLKGCLTCNIWSSVSGERVELSVEDLRALQELRWAK